MVKWVTFAPFFNKFFFIKESLVSALRFYLLYKFNYCLCSPSIHLNCWVEKRFLKNAAWSKMSNFLKHGCDDKNLGGKFWLGGTSKNVEGQICDLQMDFPVIWTKIWKFHPSMMELQIWEIWEKIQQLFEPYGASRNMRRCILEVKSWRTKMLIKNIFVYHFADPGDWQNLWRRGGSRKRGYWFLNRGWRHFYTFALVAEEYFMHTLSIFCFLVTKQEWLVKALYAFPEFMSHMKTMPDLVYCKWSKIHKQV